MPCRKGIRWGDFGSGRGRKDRPPRQNLNGRVSVAKDVTHIEPNHAFLIIVPVKMEVVRAEFNGSCSTEWAEAGSVWPYRNFPWFHA